MCIIYNPANISTLQIHRNFRLKLLVDLDFPLKS